MAFRRRRSFRRRFPRFSRFRRTFRRRGYPAGRRRMRGRRIPIGYRM